MRKGGKCGGGEWGEDKTGGGRIDGDSGVSEGCEGGGASSIVQVDSIDLVCLF